MVDHNGIARNAVGQGPPLLGWMAAKLAEVLAVLDGILDEGCEPEQAPILCEIADGIEAAKERLTKMAEGRE